MFRKSFLRPIVTGLVAASLAVGAFAGSALADGRPAVPDPDPLPLRTAPEPLPPNCEYVTYGSEGGLQFHTIECYLPPECYVVSEGDGELQFSWVECDIPEHCELVSYDWNGHTVWDIECYEIGVSPPDPFPLTEKPHSDDSAPVELPPNCEWVPVGEGPIYSSEVQCHLPPECEIVTIEGEVFDVSWIECDIDDACELVHYEWNGQTVWDIECDETACDGGCGPQPIDPVFTSKPADPPPPQGPGDLTAKPAAPATTG